jgi:cobyrinic acid a,c-diamide synthase
MKTIGEPKRFKRRQLWKSRNRPSRRHDISLVELVDWAEEAMREGEFADREMDAIRDVIARIGVADVRAFGLAWEDCEEMLRRLGYKARISVMTT